MQRRHWTVLVLAVSLVGCGDRSDSSDETAEDPAAASETSPIRGRALRSVANAGGFIAEVTPLGGTVPMNEPFSVELALFAPDGATPFEPEEVTLDARMEEHEHGMLRDVALARIAPGRWRADGLLFHMVGSWQFQVDVRQGARVERAQMDFMLR